MNQRALDNLKRLRDDFTFYAPRMLKIRTKDGQLVPFGLNNMQRKIDAEIERLKAAQQPIRIIILKYRQGGASTYTEGRIFHSTSMTKLTNSLIVAHEDDASSNLFSMSKLFFDELPTELKPMKKASNAKELVFENPTLDQVEKRRSPGLRSRIKIATANNLGAGRSATIHNLHASEVAFWRDGKTIMLGLMQAVPNTPNTMVILESTANGVGGYFYEEWQRAKSGESDFIALFFAWFEEPLYEMDVPADFTRTEEEQQLATRFPAITDRKLVWRRWCIKNNCGGDPETFKQEYPSDDEEAFLVSGRPRFDREALSEYRSRCVNGIVGNIDGGVLHPTPDGFLEVWERPVHGREYYIGADVAKGLETGDYSAAVVMDADYNIAALWHGHIDPDLFAAELDKLGNYYGEAMIAVEENNHGLTVINRLKESYWNLYKRTTLNKATDETREEIGWYSTEKSKQLAINHLAMLIRERRLGLRSSRILAEARTYVIEANGATNAQPGSHDDTIMAAAIASKVVEQHGGMFTTGIVETQTAIPETSGSFVMQDGAYVPKGGIDSGSDDEGDWFMKAGW